MTNVIELSTVDEVSAHYYREGWTDGLPIVAPTEAAVARFLEYTDLAADHVVTKLPPDNAGATVELIAANSIMAGCTPELFPVVLTAVRAIGAPEFNLLAIQTTTNCVTPLVLVNGPIGRELDFNGAGDCLGPGNLANATVGRAVRLCMRNIGGARDGDRDKSTQGQPGKYALCFRENEEASPWAPYHVDRGYDAGDSTVSVFDVTGTQHIVELASKSARNLLKTIANSVANVGTSTLSYGGTSVLILCPEHANILADGGLSKRDVQEFLYENGRVRVSEFSPDAFDLVTRRRRPYRYSSGDLDSTIPFADSPDDIRIVVAGGAGPHSTFCSGLIEAITPVTEPIAARDGRPLSTVQELRK